MSNELLARVSGHLNTWLDKREQLVAKREAILKDAEMDKRDVLNEAEEAEYQTLGTELREADEHITKFRERIGELEEEQRRGEEAEEARKLTVNVDRSIRVSERRTYDKDNPTRSYFLDLARSQFRGDPEARQRLDRHAVEVLSGPEFRDLNRTDGTGGQFVPPAYLMDQFMRMRRAGRATANVVRNLPLPGGTDSITIPGLSTGAATALQSADNAAVQETDPADRSVSVPVRTIAGQVDVALQLLDQSPIAADEIILDDLIRSYNNSLGTQILTAASWGLLNAGGNAVTYTDTTPTVGELYRKVADAVNRVSTGIFSEPTVIAMHPRRWAWFLAETDSQGRPLVVPIAGGNQSVNGIGTLNGDVGGVERVVGTLLGIPVITDPNLPTNLGVGVNEDAIVVMDAREVFLYESAPRTRVLPEVGSGTLTVRLQVYGYFAFTAARYTAAVSIITGTGLVTPTF